MVRAITLSLLFFFIAIAPISADTYPEVLFENSVLGGNYINSQIHYDGMSWVENVGGKFPISDSIFFTPGNSLSLKYTSAENSDWRARICYPNNTGGYHAKAGDALTFKLFVASNTGISALPKLAIFQHDTLSDLVDLSNYITEFQTNMWLSVSLPLKDIGGLRLEDPIDGVQFSQGAVGDSTHWLYIDQMEFLPITPPRVKLSSPAVLSSAKAYDRHVDLTWQLPLTPSIRYIKIYRSEDNEHFEPVAIRPIFVQKCTDYVPLSNKTYYYKIAWVDYDYLESPFSTVTKAKTKTASDEEMLDFVQAAHLNYFLERAEVNSGMHTVKFGVDDAIVSVRETGLSILAQIVGAERGLISRSTVVSRLQRVLGFLDKVDRYNGAFPALIDGRTGKGVFDIDSIPMADLASTAFLMQGLLVAQQYLQVDSGEVDPLVEKIDTLWKEIAWNQFTIEGQENILLDKWSPVAGFKYAHPLGGFDPDFICYILALASPQHALAPSAYTEGLGVCRKLIDSTHTMELVNNPSFSVQLNHNIETVSPRYQEFPYTSDTTLYGLKITVGTVDTSLLEAYTPFLAFDPRNKKDKFTDYFVNNTNLTKAYQRRDNESGYGGSSLDVWGSETQPDISLDTLKIINPAIASASYGYLPNEAIKSIKMFYNEYGSSLFTEYGFRKWIAIKENAVTDEYDALHQAAVVVMIENGRSGLIWDLFSNHPDIKSVIESHFTVE
ncbi:glucoamylase family protein [Parapedobacter tibetensis]|uniref:glucoamylase family protein n=1 Tax=Parapedobacter tibetensis TaxID=2972951 RepID=UPI00214D3ECD|nr:glucoamylase family protein [Parapedobacter tibetensis]